MAVNWFARSLSLVALGLGVGGLGSSAWAQGVEICGSRGSVQNLEVIGLTTDGRLICFRESQPGQVREIGTLTGLMGGESLVGIDYRPADGMLYGLGNAGGIYKIDITDASTVRQATLRTDMGMPVALSGRAFGIDFNPVPDRLRIISDAGQNLRVNVDTGATIVDTPLSPAPGTGVAAAAYTNNDGAATTATVLYDIDTMADQLTIQAPPNAGSLNAVGALGVDADSVAGFDIFSVLQDGGAAVAARAVAALRVGGGTRLFGVNLTTGTAMPGGTFGNRNSIVDLAIPLIQGDPENAEQPQQRAGRRGRGERAGQRD